MNRIKTWAQLLAEIKSELEIQSATVDQDEMLLAWANESLVMLAQSGKDLREARIDTNIVIANAGFVTVSTLAIANIDQISYKSFSIFHEWELSEQQGIQYPPANTGCPMGYTISMAHGTVNFPTYTIRFSPPDTGQLGDEVHIIGTGFTHIQDGTTNLYWFPYYEWMKEQIRERYGIFRGEDPQKLQLVSKRKVEAGQATIIGTRDSANTENAPKK